MRLFNTLIILFFSFTVFAQTQVDFYTSMGDFRVEVREDLMPITAGNFIDLVQAEYYDGIIFHRVVEDFVIQGGDPTGTGSGGPGYTIDDEYHQNMNHDSTGVMGMAKTAAPNSAGSQFYFIIGPQSFLDVNYAVFGTCIQNVQILEDMNVVQVNSNDRPLVDIVMDSLRVVPGTTAIQEIVNRVEIEAYPNPFIGPVTINYEVETAGDVELTIHDLQGRLVRTLFNGKNPSGIHSIEWDGTGMTRTSVPQGAYYLTLTTSSGVGVKMLIKTN